MHTQSEKEESMPNSSVYAYLLKIVSLLYKIKQNVNLSTGVAITESVLTLLGSKKAENSQAKVINTDS